MTAKTVLFSTLIALAAVGKAHAQTAPTPGSCVSLPPGFTPLFDGKTSKGWHVSRSAMHGTDFKVSVQECALYLNRHPYGQGGVLLTDRTFKNFELYVEAKPDFHDNSGIFLRSTEGAAAYQIELVRPGRTGALISEYVPIGERTNIGQERNIDDLWKDGEWNSIRIRFEGDAPHITVWINGEKLWEAQMAKNDMVGGGTSGHIGLQMHLAQGVGTGSGVNAIHGFSEATQRFRNIGVKELP